ncbi:MAG TPA: aspartate carbamoyltransferase [Thermoplasmata archaeon]|nr:aspartate carbamoyltransferase [Thermoplasmata archaeon]
MNFKNRHVVRINDFSKDEILYILDEAEKMLPIAKGKKKSNLMEGKILSTLFFEPSTRTRLSFECAMIRLGGKVVGFSEAKTSSVSKGETLADTMRMASAYSDIIVLRHPSEGAARLASQFSSKPVINGGDGAGQHPTQTLLDLFTIRKEKGRLNNLEVTILGDLKYGRTTHSLAYALAQFNIKLNLVAPKQLFMPEEVILHLTEMGADVTQTTELKEAIATSDVLYCTRIQKERFADETEYLEVKDIYQVDREVLKHGKEDLIVLHPLPRRNEILPEVDATPHAKYFVQAFNGVPVRMALIKLLVLG